MGKKSSETKNEPWAEAKPYLLQGAGAVNNAYNDNAGAIQGATNSVTSLLPSAIDKYKAGNPAVNAAQSYNTDVLSGRYLDQGNPYLQNMIDKTGADVRNQTSAALGPKGLTGGSAYTDIISRNLADNSMKLRYQDYSQERGMMGQAAGQAPGIAAADTIQISPMLSLLNAYNTPLNAASSYAGSLGGLLGGYNQQSKQPSTMDSIGQGLGAAASLATLFSDERLKEDIVLVGETPGGLPTYHYRYRGHPGVFRGVMAQDVARLQPEALGPVIGGYMTVNYAEVR